MRLKVKDPRVALEAGQVLTLDNAEGVHIRPAAARLWVTEEGEYSDYVVKPGEDFVVHHDGRTIVQALDPTWVEIEERAAA